MHLNLHIYSKFVFHVPIYLFSMSQYLVHSLCSISTAFCYALFSLLAKYCMFVYFPKSVPHN